MIASEPRYDPGAWAGYDLVADVRSPGEYAEDHVPGAVNLPVLDDAQRAEVGAVYVQRSKFEARRLGAALIARNAADHLQGPQLCDRPAAHRLLIYCWRGGQRSGAMATILDQVGWRTATLQGGYATYRRQVVAALYGPEPARLRPVLLAGPTGTAKTEILQRVATLGWQTLDLERLAAHRGSLLGAWPGRPQPPQKLFESRLWAELRALDPKQPVLIEAESSKVGERVLPPALWSAMQAAPRIALSAPAPARAAYLARTYGDTTADPHALEALIARMPVHHGQARRSAWRGLLAHHAWADLALALIEEHYDPAYGRSARREGGRRELAEVAMADLDAAEQARAAGRIANLLEAIGDQA